LKIKSFSVEVRPGPFLHTRLQASQGQRLGAAARPAADRVAKFIYPRPPLKGAPRHKRGILSFLSIHFSRTALTIPQIVQQPKQHLTVRDVPITPDAQMNILMPDPGKLDVIALPEYPYGVA